MEMSRNKTGKSDAESITQYTKHIYNEKELDKNLFTPKNKEFERLQFLVTRLKQLGKIKSQETNRLDVSQDKTTIKSIREMLLNIEKQQLKLQKEINKIVDSSEEPTLPLSPLFPTLPQDIKILEKQLHLNF